jgi:hypothetical protein
LQKEKKQNSKKKELHINFDEYNGFVEYLISLTKDI